MSTWSDIEKYYENQLKIIANRCREILEDSIDEELYQKYQPHVYERTYQLLNNVRAEIKDGYICVYINTGNMHYTSAVTGEDVTPFVPLFVSQGHNTNYAGTFMYDNYPSRDFLRVAKERIESELGLSVTIIENEL